jgi:hypothetical protein
MRRSQSRLALKLWSIERKSHVMALVAVVPGASRRRPLPR